MKIVHVVDSMEVGGAEKVTATLCRLQNSHGHSTSVSCLYNIGPIGQDLASEAVEVTLHSPPAALGLMRSLARFFRSNKPDVVHCHNATAAIVAAIPARLAGVKTVVVTRHGLSAPPYSVRGDLKFAFASRFCDWIIAVCDAAKLNLMRVPFAEKKKCVRIYNGVCPVDVGIGMHSQKLGFTVLHVGRLVKAKDQKSLLRAFAFARRELTDLQLWIVGDGPLRRELHNLADQLGISRSTVFFGQQSDVSPFYRTADLFVMSSVSEGLPMALLEAMSAGLPAVVTDVGGMGEVSRLTNAVRSVPVGNCRALADALIIAAKSQVADDYARHAAQECYKKNFTPMQMANQYYEYYRPVYSRHPVPIL